MNTQRLTFLGRLPCQRILMIIRDWIHLVWTCCRMISVMDPSTSWATKWLHLSELRYEKGLSRVICTIWPFWFSVHQFAAKSVPGCYTLMINDEMPDSLRDLLEDRGILPSGGPRWEERPATSASEGCLRIQCLCPYCSVLEDMHKVIAKGYSESPRHHNNYR